MENRRPITYTFEDIKRYRQGLMNREEMHAFEKASMEDPFLADALEGFMEADMTLADEHLNNIKERIAGKQEEKEKAVVVAMPQKRFGFMRVAAMVIVIAGAGLLTYKILDKKETAPSDQIAEKTVPATNKLPGEDPRAAAPLTTIDSADKDKAGTGTNRPAQEKEDARVIAQVDTKTPGKTNESTLAVNQNPSTPEVKDKVTDEKGKPAKTLPIYDNPVRAEEVVATNTTKYRTERNQALNNQITGRVVSTNNQPLANANIRLDNSRKVVVTDDAGNFSLNAADTVVLATVETSGYIDTRVELRSNTTNTINLGSITLRPDPSFNEIAVTGLGSSKQKNRVADTLTSKPEGGWESFQLYVANKLNIPLDTTGRNTRITGGELEIEFFVDAKGNPKDFKVINSTNPSLNEQAIDALKQGPKWTNRKKKARILIRY